MKVKLFALASVASLVTTVLLVGCSSKVDISIVTTSPQNETITFSQADDVAVAAGSAVNVTVAETFDSYEWLLDGATLAGETPATVSIDTTVLTTGVHHLSAFVDENGRFYSRTLRFRIEN
jgi:hypothetical protein